MESSFSNKKNQYKNMTNKSLKETLFGDMNISDWIGNTNNCMEMPWKLFNDFKKEKELGYNDKAKNILYSIIDIPGLESRHYLQAWHFLNEIGEQPSANISKTVYGIVIEVSLPNGLDIVAVYNDFSARYINYTGGAIIWDHPDNSLNDIISQILSSGQKIASIIGKWEGNRPTPPEVGFVRVNLLTPLGLLFGQGPFEAMIKDQLCGPVINYAAQFIKDIMSKIQKND